jgi:RimJ/RimL family protein N-acetyltransferase
MSSIRRATEADAPAIARMGMAFIGHSGRWQRFAPTPEELEERARAIVAAPDCAVFVADRDGAPCAMLIGAIVGTWFAPTTLVASELAWWVEPEARGTPIAVRLVRAYEEWARENGASMAAMSSLDACEGERVGTMLARLGYDRAETFHLKEV